MTRSLVLGAIGLTAVSLVSPASLAQADEVKPAVSASMILNLLARPVDSRESALDQSLREEPPPLPSASVPEVMPDGSVRYGRTTITVKNPCPPGTVHFDPPPLPGRRAR